MGLLSSLFRQTQQQHKVECAKSGHRITESVGNRYVSIVRYFLNSPFGYNPADLTILSLLPPIDRCLILEQIYLQGAVQQRMLPVWIDKLSMAYWKVKCQVSYGTMWWECQAIEFLKSCQYGSRAGFLSEDERDYQEDKIIGLRVENVSKSYYDTRMLLREYVGMSPSFVGLLNKMCSDFAGREIFANINLSTCRGYGDYVIFVNDRTDFLKEATGRAGGNALMTNYRIAKDKYMSTFPEVFAPWWFGEIADYENRISTRCPFTEEEGIAELPEYVKKNSPCWLMV